MDPLAQIVEAVHPDLPGDLDLAARRRGVKQPAKAVVHRLEDPLGIVEGLAATDGVDEIDLELRWILVRVVGTLAPGPGHGLGAPPTRRAGEGRLAPRAIRYPQSRPAIECDAPLSAAARSRITLCTRRSVLTRSAILDSVPDHDEFELMYPLRGIADSSERAAELGSRPGQRARIRFPPSRRFPPRFTQLPFHNPIEHRPIAFATDSPPQPGAPARGAFESEATMIRTTRGNHFLSFATASLFLLALSAPPRVAAQEAVQTGTISGRVPMTGAELRWPTRRSSSCSPRSARPPAPPATTPHPRAGRHPLVLRACLDSAPTRPASP